MELCTIEDAFPNIGGMETSGTPFVGGKDDYSSREERRAAKKKRSRRVKGATIMHSDADPDRPAVERMPPIDTVQQEKEAFDLPVLPKASCLFSETGTPNYFGKWAEDDVEEGFSSFNPSPTDDANYRLYPDFTKSDVLKGAAKAAGQNLPEPPLKDQWKPMTKTQVYTAYYDDPPKRKETQKNDDSDDKEDKDDKQDKKNRLALKRIDELMSRLEQLEKKHERDSQSEILMFVGTGIFLLISFDIMTRR